MAKPFKDWSTGDRLTFIGIPIALVGTVAAVLSIPGMPQVIRLKADSPPGQALPKKANAPHEFLSTVDPPNGPPAGTNPEDEAAGRTKAKVSRSASAPSQNISKKADSTNQTGTSTRELLSPGADSGASQRFKEYSGPYFKFNYPADWAIDAEHRMVTITSTPNEYGRIFLTFTPQPAKVTPDEVLLENENRFRQILPSQMFTPRVQHFYRNIGPYGGSAVLLRAQSSPGVDSLFQATLLPVGTGAYLDVQVMVNEKRAGEARQLEQRIVEQIMGQLK